MSDIDVEVYLDNAFKDLDFNVYIGLYQHYTGDIVFVKDIVRNEYGMKHAVYFNVLKPNAGVFVRPCGEFFDIVKDWESNVTGQIQRFERLYSIQNSVKNISTAQLIEELSNRKDSILQCLDIPDLAKRVFSRDYVVGEPYELTENTPKGVATVAVFDTREQAEEFLNHNACIRYKIFKRTFIEDV